MIRARTAPKMKICFVLDSAYLAFEEVGKIGGAELQIGFFAEKLASLGHTVTILSRKQPSHHQIEFRSSSHLLRSLRKARPDIVIATVATKTTIKAALVSRALGIPFVYRLAHDVEATLGTDRTSGGPLFERALFGLTLRHLTARIWCQHEGQREELASCGLGSKLFVVRNAFPLDKRAEKKRTTILWVGRCERWKRPELLVKLAKELPQCRFEMVCPGAEASLKKACAALPNITLSDYVPFGEIH